MKKITGMGSALLMAVALPLSAQQPAAGQPQDQQSSQQTPAAPKSLGEAVATAAFNTLGNKVPSPECSADKDLHFKTKSGKTYINSALQAGFGSPNTERILGDAERVIRDAMSQNGQDKSPGAWYFLGMAELLKGSVEPADSALDRAEALAPDCKAEIAKLRRIPFIPLYNRGVTLLKAGQTDSALYYYRAAASINPDAPESMNALANIYLQQKQPDSAIVYLQKVIDMSAAPEKADARNNARYNLAVLYINSNRSAQAVPLLQSVLKERPDDQGAKQALSVAYRNTGNADSANALAGSSGDINSAGAQAFKAGNYAEAEKSFQAALERDPFSRDALYNLANVYFATKNGPALQKTAERLAAIDPLNEDVLKLQANGYKLAKDQAAQIKIVTRLLGLPTSINVDSFQPTEAGATLTATATGRKAINASGAPIKPSPLALDFEFIDSTGRVVATQPVQVPALNEGQTQQVNVTAQGSGITAWRYHEKGQQAAEKTPAAKKSR